MKQLILGIFCCLFISLVAADIHPEISEDARLTTVRIEIFKIN